MGRHLKTLVKNAGFEDVEWEYSTDVFDAPADVKFLEKFLLGWGLPEEFRERTGTSRSRLFDWWAQVKWWAQHPGAVGCFHFGHAVCRKPE